MDDNQIYFENLTWLSNELGSKKKKEICKLEDVKHKRNCLQWTHLVISWHIYNDHKFISLCWMLQRFLDASNDVIVAIKYSTIIRQINGGYLLRTLDCDAWAHTDLKRFDNGCCQLCAFVSRALYINPNCTIVVWFRIELLHIGSEEQRICNEWALL